MKRLTVVLVVLGLLSLGGVAMAQDTATVTVSAQVVGTCKFVAPGTAALAFGVLPFDVNGNALGAAASTTLNFWCTNRAAYTITDNDGLYETGVNANRMRSDTVLPFEYIDYTFTYNPASGTGAGPANPFLLTINGTVGTTYAANSPDTYSDTVTLTINP